MYRSGNMRTMKISREGCSIAIPLFASDFSHEARVCFVNSTIDDGDFDAFADVSFIAEFDAACQFDSFGEVDVESGEAVALLCRFDCAERDFDFCHDDLFVL